MEMRHGLKSTLFTYLKYNSDLNSAFAGDLVRHDKCIIKWLQGYVHRSCT